VSILYLSIEPYFRELFLSFNPSRRRSDLTFIRLGGAGNEAETVFLDAA